MGPEFQYLSDDLSNTGSLRDVKATAYAIGVRGKWYKNGFGNDIYLGGCVLASAEVKARGTSSGSDVSRMPTAFCCGYGRLQVVLDNLTWASALEYP